MVQEDMTIEEAIKVMEEGQKAPDRVAPMLPPKVLGEFQPYTAKKIYRSPSEPLV